MTARARIAPPPGVAGATGRMVAAAALTLLPLAAVAMSPWRAMTALVLLGMMPALAASPISRSSATRAILPVGAVGLIATAMAASGPLLPLTGTALVMALAMWTAGAVPSGLASARVVLIIVAAHLVVDPAGLLPDAAAVPTPVAAAIVSVVLAAAAAWIAAVIALLLPERRPAPVRPVDGVAYRIVLTAVCGGLTLVCLLWLPGTESWWMVLTATLVLTPTASGTVSRAAHRVGGTLLGAAISVAAAAVAPATALGWIGLIAACACAGLSVGGAPYWMFTTAVTTAVLTLTFTRTEMVDADLARLLSTVCAACASIIAWAVWAAFRGTGPRRRGSSDPAPHPCVDGSAPAETDSQRRAQSTSGCSTRMSSAPPVVSE